MTVSPKRPSFPEMPDKGPEERLSDEELLEGAKEWLQRIEAASETFDTAIFKTCRAVSATMDPFPTIVFELEVLPLMVNGSDNFHGGAITTTFDNLTTCPLFLTSRPGVFQMAGVSRNLSVSFLRPAPVGTIVVIECSVINMGRRLALLRGEMRRKSDGALVAICMHDKANNDPESSGKL